MIKKILAITMATTLIVGGSWEPTSIYAVDNTTVSMVGEDNQNFTENMEDYEYIEQKVEDELSVDTGLLEPEVEEALNEQGVFDDEICQYSETYIDELNKLNPEDIEVQAEYYAIKDTEELNGVSVTDEEMVPVSDEKINAYIAEEYYDEEAEDSEEDKVSVIEGILEGIGIRPLQVKAETQHKGGTNDKKNKTMLKKTIICTKAKNKKNYLYVHAIFKWDQMPKYRELDTIAMKWDNVVYDYAYARKTSVSHFWTKHQYEHRTDGGSVILNEKYVSESVNMKYNDNYNTLKNNQYYLDNYGIRCAFKLHKNNDTALANSPYVKTKEYSNEGIGIIFYLKRKSNIVVFHPYYKHIQTKREWVSVAVCLADKGRFTAIYTTVTGKNKTVTESFVGVDEAFRFTIK